MPEELTVTTHRRSEMLDITAMVQQAVSASGTRDGVCHVFVPHTTAGITVNENADPHVPNDILSGLDRMAPWDAAYRHTEGNAAAHIKASLLGCSVALFVRSGKLVLGTWQGVFFCEFDGPRSRRVLVAVSP
jgi:secondary thiamine-phosphate synthase enzyme